MTGNLRTAFFSALLVIAVAVPVFGLKLIWAIADISNALMLVPTLVGTLLLSGVVGRMYHDYVRRLRAGGQPADGG